MDIVHHSLIGGAGMLVAASQDAPLVGFAFVAASVIPDLDVIFMALGKRFYLKNHQAITHSVILAPVYALLLSVMLLLPMSEWWRTEIFLAALAGLYLHITLDWFNTFRIALFSPFIKKRYSLDAVFFIDAVTLSLTAMFYLLYLYTEITAVTWLYPLSFVLYFLAKLILQRKVRRKLRVLFAIPSSLNPFEFFVLSEDEFGFHGYVYNSLTGSRKKKVRYPYVDNQTQSLAEKSQVYHDMKRISRALRITSVEKTEEGTRIRANDIAVRNFGGKFASTTLDFDKDGNLIREVANI